MRVGYAQAKQERHIQLLRKLIERNPGDKRQVRLDYAHAGTKAGKARKEYVMFAKHADVGSRG